MHPAGYAMPFFRHSRSLVAILLYCVFSGAWGGIIRFFAGPSTLESVCSDKDFWILENTVLKEVLMSLRVRLMFCFGSAFFVQLGLGAEDWPGWRGHDGNGISGQSGFPLEWSHENQNLLWSVKVAQWGNSSPCIVGDRIYLTAQKKDDTLHVLSVDRVKGQVVWKSKVGEGAFARSDHPGNADKQILKYLHEDSPSERFGARNDASW